MCLAIPGLIENIYSQDEISMAKVNFGGVKRATCLAYVPEAKEGDYVLVHVGFALSVINEQEAQNTLKLLEGFGELEELESLTQPEHQA